jgi:hypothetical protein
MSSLVPEPGSVTRLVADTATERRIVLTRGALGVVLLACSAWVFAAKELIPGLLAGAAVVFAMLWIVRAVRVLRAPPAAGPEDFLELSHQGLAVREQGRELRLPWSEIVRVAIDEDRVNLAVLCKTGEIVHIEPRFRGVSLEALCSAAAALHSSAAGPHES